MEIFPNQVFLDSPVNLGIVGEIISECTRPQTADQLANCSELKVDETDLQNQDGTMMLGSDLSTRDIGTRVSYSIFCGLSPTGNVQVQKAA